MMPITAMRPLALTSCRERVTSAMPKIVVSRPRGSTTNQV
jgi:hypothetical protein